MVFFKEFRSPYTRDFYSRVCPKVKLPEYSESAVMKKKAELEEKRIRRRNKYLTYHLPLHFVKITLITGILMAAVFGFWGAEVEQLSLAIVNATWPEGERPTEMMVEPFSALFNMLWVIYVLIFGFISDFHFSLEDFRETKYHEAEFELRWELTKQQRTDANETGDNETWHEIWLYCNSANKKSLLR